MSQRRGLMTTAFLATLLVTACAKPETVNSSSLTDNGGIDSNGFDLANVAEADPATVAAPTQHYQEREGDRYLYVSALSDEDRQKGKAVGGVVEYRYLGERNGMLTLQEVSESGFIVSQLECSRDCRIMKIESSYGAVSRLPYDPTSIGGAAMEDALNGFLTPVKTVVQPPAVPVQPQPEPQAPPQITPPNSGNDTPEPTRNTF